MDGNDELGRLITLIPKGHTRIPHLPCHCCCDRTDCAFLKNIHAAFEQLENDLRAAAQLGQALLARHKNYIHDTERERSEMAQKYIQLEHEKKVLVEDNTKVQETNLWLMDQLEELNYSVGKSETYIKALEATLDSTRFEFKRLQSLAARTQDLENQLAILEREQEKLQNTFSTTHKLKQKAVQRWKIAEKRLSDFQEEMELIDRETKEERERHNELLAQMNRQRVVERKLCAIAGLSKGDNKISQDSRNTCCKSVLPFVRDILQDNASLQSGILELRDLLLCSNDETQVLREQLMEQQILGRYELGNKTHTLGTELTQKDTLGTAVINHNLHIHHHHHYHYHASPKKQEIQKSKRKGGLARKGFSTPLGYDKYKHRRKITESSVTSQVSMSAISNQSLSCKKHSSGQEAQVPEYTSSSLPNSPQSFCKNNIVFDKISDIDSSGPTSPGSSIDHFPIFDLCCRPGSDILEISSLRDSDDLRKGVIDEEQSVVDEHTKPPSNQSSREYVPASWNSIYTNSPGGNAFHEPIALIPGIDKHNLKVQRSETFLSQGNPSFDRLHLKTRLESPSMINLRENITASASTVMAQPILTIHEGGQESSSKLLSSMLAHDTNQKKSAISTSKTSSTKLSSWLRGRWSYNSTTTEHKIWKNGSSMRCYGYSVKRKKSPKLFQATVVRKSLGSRPPGINQKGPVPGFSKKPKQLPCQISPADVNYDALYEVLTEDLDAMTLK